MIAAPPLALPAVLVPLILEAALRALLAAVAVWAGLRLLSVGNVLVQKTAWGLVLVAALALPLVPHWQALPTLAALRLPALPLLAPISDQVRTKPPAAGPASALAPSPDRYPAPSISTADFNKSESSAFNETESTALNESGSTAPFVRAAPDPALSSPESASEPIKELNDTGFNLKDASSSLKGMGFSLKDTGFSMKGTGFSPYINQAKKPRALAPAVPHFKSSSLPISIPSASTTAAKQSPTPVSLVALGWLLYLGVFAALLIRLLFGLASALRLWLMAKPVSELPGSEPSQRYRLRSSSRVASPVNIGSAIILPADFANWGEEKLRVVLAHERSHVRQGDFYLQLFAGLYAAIFWFSPLGWWLKRKLTELSEAISDRAGLEEAASRSSYAQLLLEFAALPRPTLTGVAMARSSHLAQRIERLLYESSFRQAFAAGGRRALLAVFLVPAALFASTALVRVEAAAAPMQQASPQAQPSPQEPIEGQSTPEQVTQPAPAPAPAPTPEGAPVPPPPPSPAPSPDAAPPLPPPDGDVNPEPPPPPPNPEIGDMPPMPPMPDVNVQIPPESIHVHIDPAIRAEIAAAREEARQYRNYSDDGEPYALVGDPGSKPRFNGHWDDGDRGAEIEKARKAAHGHFLWFRHEGKSYIVDDPAIVSQLEAMNKPMDDLSKQMHALGEQMRALGEQQREMGKQMRDITVPTPDLSKEMAELNAAVASLKAKQGGTISEKELGDLQREFGRIQGELGALQGKIGAQQGALGGNMGKFGGQMGELGGQMGKLGAQMGQLSRENQSKVKTIIDETLKDGKAKPVE